MKCPKCQQENPDTKRFCADCGTRLSEAAEPRASFTRTLETTAGELSRGMLFAGRYEIIEELGSGGMGRVYRVHDTKLNEEVALKLIRPGIGADRRTIERFRNEIKTARRISHKNICRTHDLGEEGEILYLTMEYVRGEDLKTLIRRMKALTVGAAVAVARQMAEGLREAHKQGIVHRDLKPGNIMIDKDGQAKIMDFGIARSLQGGAITGEGAIIGTPEYMSPEQVEGKPADARSDVYALGVVFFEMVTGRAPFEGETPFSVANKQKTEPPPIPRKLVPQIPESLNRLILRCLEKDAAKRFQTVEDFLVDLAGVEQALPAAERPPLKRKTLTGREITVHIRPRRLAFPAAVIATVALGGFFLLTKVISPPGPPLPAAKPTLALLAIRNSSGDPSLDLWKDNLPALLGGGLSQSRYLRVLDEVQVYGALKKLGLVDAEKFSPGDLKSIGAEGGATHLLAGSFLSAGSRFIINLSLIDSGTGAVVRPIREEAPTKEGIYESVDSLVGKIKAALNVPEQDIDESTYKMIGDVYTRNPQALREFVEGEKAHQTNDYPKAAEAFLKAAELDPDFAMAFRMLALVQNGMGNFVDGYRSIRKAFDLRNKLPEKDRLLVEAGWYMLREETFPKAEAVLRRAVERYPEDFQAWSSLAYVAEDYEKQIRILNLILNSGNRNQSVLLYVKLAHAFCAVEDYKKASGTLEESLRRFPPADDWPRIMSLANLFLLDKNFKAAQEQFEKAAALAPDDPYAKTGFVTLDWGKGNTDQALRAVEAVLGTQQDRSIFDDSWLPTLYLEKGKFREALDIIGKWEREFLIPNAGPVFLARGLNSSGKEFLQTGNPEKALERFLGGLESLRKVEEQIDDARLDNLMHLKRLLMTGRVCSLCDLGRVQEAEAVQKELESLIPGHIPKGRKACRCMNTALPAGKIALAKKDAAGAVRILEESLREMPGEDFSFNDLYVTDHAYLLDLLGEAYRLAGRLNEAAETFARIRALFSGRWDWGAVYARSYFKLGGVFEEMGLKDEARREFGKFLDLWKDADPGLPEVGEAKRRLAVL